MTTTTKQMGLGVGAGAGVAASPAAANSVAAPNPPSASSEGGVNLAAVLNSIGNAAAIIAVGVRELDARVERLFASLARAEAKINAMRDCLEREDEEEEAAEAAAAAAAVAAKQQMSAANETTGQAARSAMAPPAAATATMPSMGTQINSPAAALAAAARVPAQPASAGPASPVRWSFRGAAAADVEELKHATCDWCLATGATCRRDY
ncbi:hypothetical protein B0T26DRAFT_807904 [Lasiosphaeria miniovina]|uniref:Uncharacterized protein n=1 Tax=Lasiosphaeria miniovina TaxID=1954250 RepID=A0AA39ZR54_9PEZI|nr:uncharacterized protein B0T26DRAFT_807904 [Lasiosphaeria miniovina]KAK0702113.1 hypothetical protein B0T26DRAFT_807904 [Lasiosphaeria miniovina]